MPKKKSVKKTASGAKSKKEHHLKKPVKISMDLEETLVQNIVELQKVNITMTETFDKLSKEISQLLALFETTARTFAKNAPVGEYEKDKEFLTKIDKLLDQNKILAKGLTLMEERLRERMYGAGPAHEEPENTFRSQGSTGKKPLPRF